MAARHTSVETRWMQDRDRFFTSLRRLDRRDFLRVSSAAAVAAAARSFAPPGTFQPVALAFQDVPSGGPRTFRFAYISDSHLYERDKNDRFVKALMRAVDDVNRLDPQPDFVFYGGDLAQLGSPLELDLGAQILRNLKAPLRIMVGEHDWYFDMGEKWRELFGEPTESWDQEGVHFVKLMSVHEEDFWTARGMSPAERMQTVAGLDNGVQRPFMVGAEQRAWLADDLARLPASTPLVVFSHSPLYKLYRNWNFWTDDADEIQAILRRFDNVTVVHGHTHQMLTNRIGNIHFHGLLATAWPWPYAPEGMPELTIQMARPDPFNPNDGCGDGEIAVHPDGLIDMVHNFWNRNPVTVAREYTASWGREAVPPVPTRRSF
ncbi:MAG: serine/threonine protein phosphatase [Acidobacteria bacterium]|nr:serine/threonine protein phosphatase [Acidobacteriota bacterium]